MKVSPVNVVVVFYSCCGANESLALAAAVGAVQARANIRMRRLTDAGEDIPECRETLARMRREYVPPAPADMAWADAVMVAAGGKLAGVVDNPADATVWARRMTEETRSRKQQLGL
jgi:hypothetical protein